MGLQWWLRVVYSWVPPLLSIFGRRWSGSRRPLLTAAGQYVVESAIFGIADPDLPINYATFMGLQWWLRVVYSWVPPLLSIFGRRWSGSRRPLLTAAGSQYTAVKLPICSCAIGVFASSTTVSSIWICSICSSILSILCKAKTNNEFIIVTMVRSRSLEVAPGSAYEFLFAFHSNFGAILYRLRDISTYWLKIVKLLYPTCI